MYQKLMSEEPIAVNIRRYEDLIQNKIKVCLSNVEVTKQPTLQKETTQLEELTTLVEQYTILQTNITQMKKDDSEELNTLINVGSEVYMQAKTSDKKYIFINIGLGFHAQFTLDEAQIFIEKKLKKLEAWGKCSSSFHVQRSSTEEGKRKQSPGKLLFSKLIALFIFHYDRQSILSKS